MAEQKDTLAELNIHHVVALEQLLTDAEEERRAVVARKRPASAQRFMRWQLAYNEAFKPLMATARRAFELDATVLKHRAVVEAAKDFREGGGPTAMARMFDALAALEGEKEEGGR